MHVYRCMCVDTCLCRVIWGKPEVDTGCLPQSFLALTFESGSLSGTAACWFSKAGCHTPRILSLSSQCWDYRCAATSGCFKKQNILWIVILCQRYSWQRFSPIFEGFFTWCTEIFWFYNVPLVNSWTNGVLFRKPFPTPISRRVLSCFRPAVSGFMFRFLTHLQLVFVQGVEQV